MIVYKIDETQDRNGNPKAVDPEWLKTAYILSKVVPGHSAVLPMFGSMNSLITSKVEEVAIWDNHVKVTTRNTVYYFKPVEV